MLKPLSLHLLIFEMKNNIRKIQLLGFSLLAGVSLVSCKADYKKEAKVSLANQTDSVSYILGGNIGEAIKADGLDSIINIESFFAGIQNGLLDKINLTDEQKTELITKFQTEMMSKMSSESQAKEEMFLAENATKEGIVTTASGLQYQVIEEGKGAKPTASSTVKVHYTGTLVDGTVFDSSREMDQPIEFPLDGVIPGWTEGIQLMSVGSKYKFYIPSNLAYGANGVPQGGIGPNSTLIFDVELIGIK